IKKFGEVIKKRRIELKKSQTTLAYEFDLDSGNLSRIETGQITPKLTMLWRIAEALEIKLSDLIKLLEKELGDDFYTGDK
ncbi:MAG: helix-turn-helix transcriptional regulator, partial [bacterium]|nr:helix-turn-helix transcriptional regulator [bacterium]